MLKKRILLFVLLCFISSSTACWSSTDLEEQTIPIAGSYDRGRNGQVEVGALILNLTTEATRKVSVQSFSGVNIGDSRNIRATQSQKTFIVGILQVAVFSEQIASGGLNQVIDSFLRVPQVPNFMLIGVAEGRADEIIRTPAPNYDNMGVYLMGLLQKAPEHTFVPKITLHEFGTSAYSAGSNPVLPLLKTDGKDVSISGTAIFRKDKMIAKLNLDDSRCLVLLRGMQGGGYIPFHINGKNNDLGSAFLNNSRKVTVTRQGGQFLFTIEISLKGRLIEHTEMISFLDHPEYLQEIEKAIEDQTRRECQQFIEDIQMVYGVDCIDISRYALAKWRKELTPTIDKNFIGNPDKVKIKVKVKVSLSDFGEKN